MSGIGLDVVEIARFRSVLARRPAIAERIFSAEERAGLAARADPVPGLAARFAAKEATMKALGVGLGAVDLAEIEVLSAESGAPSLRTRGRAAALLTAAGVTTLHVSLTHSEAIAAAIVLAQ